MMMMMMVIITSYGTVFHFLEKDAFELRKIVRNIFFKRNIKTSKKKKNGFFFVNARITSWSLQANNHLSVNALRFNAFLNIPIDNVIYFTHICRIIRKMKVLAVRWCISLVLNHILVYEFFDGKCTKTFSSKTRETMFRPLSLHSCALFCKKPNNMVYGSTHNAFSTTWRNMSINKTFRKCKRAAFDFQLFCSSETVFAWIFCRDERMVFCFFFHQTYNIWSRKPPELPRS